jgi:hypothetical protein
LHTRPERGGGSLAALFSFVFQQHVMHRPSRTSRTLSREQSSARAISRSPRPSDSRRRISSNRRTVMLRTPHIVGAGLPHAGRHLHIDTYAKVCNDRAARRLGDAHDEGHRQGLPDSRHRQHMVISYIEITRNEVETE